MASMAPSTNWASRQQHFLDYSHSALFRCLPPIHDQLSQSSNFSLDREHESIASWLWYEQGGGKGDMLDWVPNEKFA